MIIIQQRSQRSISAPAKGPNRRTGSIETRVAVARVVGEPVCSVSHHTRAKRTSALPTSEKAWPVHTMKKGVFQFCVLIGLSFKDLTGLKETCQVSLSAVV